MKICPNCHRLLALLLVLLMMLSVAACGSQPKAAATEDEEDPGGFTLTSSNMPDESADELGDLLVNIMTASLHEENIGSDTEYVAPDIHQPFGGDQSEYMNDFNGAANAFYQLNFDQPEVLASTTSALPGLAKSIGLSVSSMEEIEAALESMDGGEIQKKLLSQLKATLEDENTQVAFGSWTGKARMTYMVKRDESVKTTPDNVYLVWENVVLENEPIFAIAVPREGGDKDFGYFAMRYGFQRMIPIVEWPIPDEGADN